MHLSLRNILGDAGLAPKTLRLAIVCAYRVGVELLKGGVIEPTFVLTLLSRMVVRRDTDNKTFSAIHLAGIRDLAVEGELFAADAQKFWPLIINLLLKSMPPESMCTHPVGGIAMLALRRKIWRKGLMFCIAQSGFMAAASG